MGLRYLVVCSCAIAVLVSEFAVLILLLAVFNAEFCECLFNGSLCFC